MNIANDAPKRPALRYYGGKWNLAPWIISYFPKHESYVEPCGGGASVLLRKPRAKLETINDLDGNVVNFFRVLRDKSSELIQKIHLTPWAREEYEFSRFLPDTDCDVERARLFWVRSVMSISGMGGNSGMRFVKNIDTAPNGIASWNYVTLEHLFETASRLRGVQIESRDYRQVIESYDHGEALIYFDPPYVSSERTSKKEYVYEWSNDQHVESAEILRCCKGFVVVSGYACPLYSELYESHGWKRIDKETTANGGSKRIESLWLSPRTQQAIQSGSQSLLTRTRLVMLPRRA